MVKIHKKTLPDFQGFLLSKGLVQEKHLSYYAYWVSRYLAFLNRNEDMNTDLKIEAFINELKKQNKITDWQVRQADDAVRLYTGNFLDRNISTDSSGIFLNRNKHPDLSSVLNEMSKDLRIRHYSYRTEKTYIYWTSNFLAYLTDTKKNNLDIASVNSDDARDYHFYNPAAAPIAPSGQASAHLPHSRQRLLSITYISPSVITSTGQDSRHNPQAVHLSVIR